jgi:putative membrane protein
MNHHKLATLAFVAATALALLAAPARAQTGQAQPNGPVGPNGVNATDQQFVMQAIKANDEEIDEARAELNSTTDANVKMFAQRMINDHTAANAQIAAIARQYNIKYPESHIATENGNSQEHTGSPPPAAANSASAATAMPPAQYMQKAVQDHQKAIALLEGEVNNGSLQQLRTVAANMLAEVRAHLAMAQQYTSTGRITPIQTPQPPANGQPPR